MRITVDRLISNPDSTIGLLMVDGKYVTFTCEGGFHIPKIQGKTRIPKGTYNVHLKQLGTSHMDPTYTSKFGEMHKGMLELQGIPDFSGVLIHIGNDDRDTEGCILIGLGADTLLDQNGSLNIQHSTEAYKRLYPIVQDALTKGQTVTIDINDHDR